jgi:hypothetical protein
MNHKWIKLRHALASIARSIAPRTPLDLPSLPPLAHVLPHVFSRPSDSSHSAYSCRALLCICLHIICMRWPAALLMPWLAALAGWRARAELHWLAGWRALSAERRGMLSAGVKQL